MVKLVILLRRRADLTREQFIDYYESRHVPLALSLAPISGYRRNYVLPETAFDAAPTGDADGGADFDVMTEIWFDSMEACAESQARMRGEAGRILHEDELKLFDMRPGAARFVMVEEHVSSEADIAHART